ncbi:MAG TPA: TetR/AcrR family transcriptional regulator [Acidimicrobiia bacterium]|nr:TetR/AcrR family transcriptional regulator [Acidimicrobiia bacterium]
MPTKQSAKPPPKPATERYHHGDLRNALIEEAGRVLESDGVEAVTFRGLARRLGVSHAAPSHHFADRHELLAELAADGYAALADALEDAMSGTPPAEWRRNGGRAYLEFGLTSPQRYRMMFASQLFLDECPERLLGESSRAYLMLLKLSYGRDPDIDPESYRVGTRELASWSAVHGAMMLWLDGQLRESVDQAEFMRLSSEMLDELFA